MNSLIHNLNKAFESRIRLGIMSALMVNESVEYTELKSLLEVTDGNLASHISALEESGYIRVIKKFIGKKPNTKYAISTAGRIAFTIHLEALEKIIKGK